MAKESILPTPFLYVYVRACQRMGRVDVDGMLDIMVLSLVSRTDILASRTCVLVGVCCLGASCIVI